MNKELIQSLTNFDNIKSVSLNTSTNEVEVINYKGVKITFPSDRLGVITIQELKNNHELLKSLMRTLPRKVVNNPPLSIRF
jgi:hypothetical protein